MCGASRQQRVGIQFVFGLLVDAIILHLEAIGATLGAAINPISGPHVSTSSVRIIRYLVMPSIVDTRILGRSTKQSHLICVLMVVIMALLDPLDVALSTEIVLNSI